jgi:prepilin-type N-terminal cleavage/methylation domain-containing protein
MKMRGRRSSRGFTLIEVMIAVAIVGILAAIAIPQYQQYILRTKRTEALTMLGTIKIAQETHRAVHDCYAPVARNPGGFASPTRRDWRTDIPTVPARPCNDLTPRNFIDLNVAPSGSVYYTYACAARWNGSSGQTEEYACSMIGDLDGDGESEIVYCTDNDEDGTCIASITGAVSNFPNDVQRVTVNIY